jgi:hypothetical protein
MRRLGSLGISLLVLSALLTALTSSQAGARTTLPKPTTSNHYVANLHGAVTAPRRIGYTIFDTGDSRADVRALPRHVRALVWLGEKCPTPATDEFRATVRHLATSRKVFGYYLSDEPHIADCPGGPAALASRASYIRQVSGGRQKSFVVLSDDEDYRPFRPAVTHLSMIGLDPYPCSIAHPTCEFRQINEAVASATAKGIPAGRLVPVYQAFGQRRTDDHYYNLPSADQMRTMIRRWATLLPHPPMDYTYGWGHQDSANPTLVDSTGLRRLFSAYFHG